jgi:antitoxin (DNA-binding transcriptional repressor) of toxin-antitoxin stability system
MMRRLAASISISLIWCAAFGQTYTISTIAGSAPQGNLAGTSAVLGGRLLGVASDAAGDLFFTAQDCVYELNAKTGILTILPGNGTAGFSGDGGPATSAQLNQPKGIAVDSAGYVYIADTRNQRIRKVSAGVITTIAGNGRPATAVTPARPPTPSSTIQPASLSTPRATCTSVTPAITWSAWSRMA